MLSAIQGSWTGAAPITFSYDWLRCTEVDCSPTGVTGTTYPLTEADVGTFVRVQETAANEGGSAAAYATSDLVSAQPKVRRLSPFPVVIIGGRVAGRGAVITTLAVRHAPQGATIALLCRGRDCPFSASTRRLRGSSRMRLRALEVELRAGTVITIFIRKGRRLGKYTRIRIQRNAPPARLDRCVKPGSRRPVRCVRPPEDDRLVPARPHHSPPPRAFTLGRTGLPAGSRRLRLPVIRPKPSGAPRPSRGSGRRAA